MKKLLALLLACLLAFGAFGSALAEAALEDPITFSIFVDHSWFWVDSFDDPCAQEITKRTNVDFDVTRATDGTQLPILIASGDLPDIVYTATTSVATQLCDPEICWTYNELVEKTGVNLDADETEILNNTRADGNYYCLLNAFTPQEALDNGTSLVSGGTNSLAYRTDIYEAIGSPEFNTVEDIEKALIASKELYPDVIPMLPDKDVLISYFAAQMGAMSSDVVYAEDGVSVQHKLNSPALLEVYKILNRWAREGLIIAEAQTYNFDKFTEVRNSGKSFMQVRSTDEAMTPNNMAIASGSPLRWKLLKHELSDEAKFYNTGIGWSGFYITKNCKDPERAMRFFEWCRSEEGRKLCSWGIEGVHWEYDENGETVTTQFYRDGMDAGKQKQLDFGIAVWIFGDKGDENAFVDHASTNPDAKDIIERLYSAAAHYKVCPELYFCIPTEGDELTIYTKLNDMMKSEVLKVIFAASEEEMQAAYDEMLRKGEQIGVGELNTWMNAQLEAHRALAK